MPEPGVPCQLEFFHDLDFSATGESTSRGDSRSTIGRMAPTALPERVRRGPREVSDLSEAELTRQATSLIADAGLPKVARKVSVHWNPRMRTAAGRAFYESLRVELNPELLKLQEIDVNAEVDRTLRHELAHLVAYHRVGRRKIAAHGKEWQQACVDLGIPDESRCHTLPFEARRVKKKLAYECPVCQSTVLRVRRFRHAVACYDCCQKHSSGRYDDRFRLQVRRLAES